MFLKHRSAGSNPVGRIMKITFDTQETTKDVDYIYIDEKRFEFWQLFNILDELITGYKVVLHENEHSLFLKDKGILSSLGGTMAEPRAEITTEGCRLLHDMSEQINEGLSTYRHVGELRVS